MALNPLCLRSMAAPHLSAHLYLVLVLSKKLPIIQVEAVHCIATTELLISSTSENLLGNPLTWGVKVFEVHAWGQMGLALQARAALWPVGLQGKGHWGCAVPPHCCVINTSRGSSLTGRPS